MKQSILCTICGDMFYWGEPHTHNPNGQPINEVADLEKIFQDDPDFRC
jgi:hypothetical protein